MSQRIILVEDEPDLLANYAAALKKYGYSVEGYSSRQSAWERIQIQLPDMVIVDIGLGKEVEGGFELCRQVRAISATLPILFLTARDSEFDQISGLRLGADDYLTKDISLPHLMARVTALFRRLDAYRNQNTAELRIERGSLTLNTDRFEALWCNRKVDLTLTEFWILHALAKRPGHVKNRTQLMEAANTVLDDSSVTSHIKRLRRKFQQLDPNFDAIQTAYGMGYRYAEDILEKPST
jgi:two-component system OmpR family response regulator